MTETARAKRPFWNRLRGLGACILVLYGACRGCNAYFDPIMCIDDTWEELTSPDGRVKAMHVQRNCGATVDFFECISIVPVSASVKDHWLDACNVVSASRDRELGENQGISLGFSWDGPKDLRVRFNRQNFVRAHRRVDGYTVHYVPEPLPIGTGSSEPE